MRIEDNRRWIISIYNPPASKIPWHFEELVLGLPVRYFSFGRLALVEAFRVCGVGGGDKVLLPSYLCRDVLASLHAVGAVPVYYPVDRNLQARFDPGSAPRCKAVLAVNYFGYAQDMNVFNQYRDRVGALLIEDNAHGLFSRDEEGCLLGTRGDVGIFCLRKTIPLPNGAALVINRPDLRSKVSEQEAFEVSDSDVFFHRKNKARRLIGLFGIWSARAIITMWRLGRKLVTGSSIPPSPASGEFVLPEPTRCTPLLKSGIRTAHPKLESDRRRELYSLLDAWVREIDLCKPVFEDLAKGVVPYGYPFFCDHGELKRIERLLSRRGFLCISWPDLPDAVRETAPSFYKEIRLVPFLW